MNLLALIVFVVLACLFPSLWVILGWMVGVWVVLFFLTVVFGGWE